MLQKGKLINTATAASFCDHKKTHGDRRKRRKISKSQCQEKHTHNVPNSVCICTRIRNSRQNEGSRKAREQRRSKGRNPFLCSKLHLFALNHAKDMALCSRAEGFSIIRLEGRKGERKEKDKTKAGCYLAILALTSAAYWVQNKSEEQKSEREICSITVA